MNSGAKLKINMLLACELLCTAITEMKFFFQFGLCVKTSIKTHTWILNSTHRGTTKMADILMIESVKTTSM